MKIRDYFRIIIVPLNKDKSIEVTHILLMECIDDVPSRYYLAELPLIDNSIRIRLKYYENLVN
jgi:hypothetical protein